MTLPTRFRGRISDCRYLFIFLYILYTQFYILKTIFSGCFLLFYTVARNVQEVFMHILGKHLSKENCKFRRNFNNFFMSPYYHFLGYVTNLVKHFGMRQQNKLYLNSQVPPLPTIQPWRLWDMFYYAPTFSYLVLGSEESLFRPVQERDRNVQYQMRIRKIIYLDLKKQFNVVKTWNNNKM